MERIEEEDLIQSDMGATGARPVVMMTVEPGSLDTISERNTIENSEIKIEDIEKFTPK